MSDYIAKFRTNYFRVKSPELFKRWVECLDFMEVASRTADAGHEEFALFCDGGMPATIEDGLQFGIEADIAAHLPFDSIAVLQEVGYDSGLGYFVGYSIAVNSDGHTVAVSLSDITAKAEASFGIHPPLHS